ncbi:iron transporter [Haloarchaeobius sp. DFWS5]|uniref:iron transporter n=1 Tax=Haloarchaeobius sp. DFWS5 TaxID=3446114 RepID=UPI003EBF9740
MNRRSFLAAGASATAAGLAGCMGLLETQTAGIPPVLSDRPDAVYFPTHIEGMKMSDMTMTGDYGIGLMYSYPHRFWTVDGTSTDIQKIRSQDAAHVMVAVWDKQSKVVLPDAGVSIEVTKDGELVTEETIYPMLSQPMGFHYGANFPLDGTATYQVKASISGLSGVRTTGEYGGKFEEGASATLKFSYSEAEKQNIMFELTDDEAGSQKAVPPMDMKMPSGVAPPPSELPGTALGAPKTGDAVLATQAVEADRFGDGTHLAVSARTPYNRMVIPLMGVRATVTRDGETVFDDQLQSTFDPELHHHYGATLDSLESGDEVTLEVTTPPQVARHEGYETAFLQFDPVTLTVE